MDKAPHPEYVPNCQFEETPEGKWKCVKCGFVSPVDAIQNCPKMGWGDRVEKIASRLGIRKCGGCERRQKRMNKWGLKK